MDTKVRKVGNAFGVVFSIKLVLKEGQICVTKHAVHGLLLGEIQTKKSEIETGFNDFKNGRYRSLEDYAKELGIKF